MPLIEIKMLVDRHTTAGARIKGDKVLLPQREAESMTARGHAKAFVRKKKTVETRTIESKPEESE